MAVSQVNEYRTLGPLTRLTNGVIRAIFQLRACMKLKIGAIQDTAIFARFYWETVWIHVIKGVSEKHYLFFSGVIWLFILLYCCFTSVPWFIGKLLYSKINMVNFFLLDWYCWLVGTKHYWWFGRSLGKPPGSGSCVALAHLSNVCLSLKYMYSHKLGSFKQWADRFNSLKDNTKKSALLTTAHY